ncbi:MAG: hypothetical protein JWQ62_1852, partial [Lacunisphaera sp.]|nr:hypothetical protein [Lacunisphaera sp.]
VARQRATYSLTLALPLAAAAQSVRWDPPGGQLGYNQVSQLSLTFENCEPEEGLKLPAVDGLQIGANPSQSTNMEMNGLSMRKTYSLIFPVRPTRRTPVTIPAFQVKTDKGPFTVKAASYSVGDATVGGTGVGINDVATAKLTVPKDSFWVGEVFPVSFTLDVVRRYFHSLAANVDWSGAPLTVEDWSKPDPSEALVRGERRVISTQTARATAKQPGTFALKPASQGVNLMVGTSGFGLFAQPTVEQRQIESNPLDVTIKPLPAPPAGFSGAVGEFTFTSKVVPTGAAIGEPVTWTIELSGTGNWPDISGLPQREVSNEFQVVQPKSRRVMKDGSLFEGTLSEDVVLVPTRAGTYKLAPVSFTYFDTKAGAYKTVSSEPVTVTITANAPPVQPPPGSGAPVQFSINPPASSATSAPALPAATPPVPPENLPRDPIAEARTGFMPFPPDNFWIIVAAPAAGVVLVAWLILAALRSRATDPQLRRRQARARLATALAELKAAGSQPSALNSQLRLWQRESAVLWEVPHAAPGAPLVHAAVARSGDAAPSPRSVGKRGEGAPSPNSAAAAEWANLWSEADRALHGRDQTLPKDWTARAETALQASRIPGWPPFSLFAPRNLAPFLLALAMMLLPLAAHADGAADAYKRAEFPAAEGGWRTMLKNSPADWTARHNLGLALAQQDRWAEATAQWTSAFLLNARADTTRWDLALGLQRSGMAPPELVELSRGEGPAKIARLAAPGEWQRALILAALLLAASLVVLLLQGYQRIGGWAKPVALTVSLLAVLLATAATLSLHTYGILANPEVALVWKASTLRSIPTDADTAQKTSALSAGSIAVAEKTFLGWTKLSFSTGQTGWARTEDLIRLYR